MTRWAAAFYAHRSHDTVDTVDTMGAGEVSAPHSVNSVHSVTPPFDGDGGENAVLTPTPEQAADEAADREAITAEGPRRAVVGQSLEELESLVARLASAMAGKHGQRITDPERAGDYFQGEARRRLTSTTDPIARGLLVSTFTTGRCFCSTCAGRQAHDYR